jgi:sialic acid synthase
MRQLQIANRVISDATPAFVIAEIGGNHGGSVETAVQMIRIAAACGADACKFQCRDNQTLYSDTLLNAAYENENSYGRTYGEHRKALELSDPALDTCCFEAERSNVLCFSTAFDEPSVDRIVKLGMPAIKIASGGLTDKRLLRHAALAQLPIILSTGGGTFREIDEAVELITCYNNDLALLLCTAAYPVRDWAEHNLQCIATMRERYPQFVIGWSGHDNGIALAVAAYALGARIIEKHFTLDRTAKGTDHAFSLEPAGLGKLVRDLKRAHAALGDGQKRYLPSEVGPISKMRRRECPDGSWKITGEKDAPTVN